MAESVLWVAEAAVRRPKVLVILAEDLDCYGAEITTPNLDRLAKYGLRFVLCYTTARKTVGEK